MEIWKDALGFEGRYQVSNLGRVRSIPHYDKWGRFYDGRVLRPQLDGRKNYLHVQIDKRSVQVHTLIAKTFIPNPDNYPQINHKDENKQNNSVDNLEWCTSSYNNTYGSRKHLKRGEKHHGAKLSETDVAQIKLRLKSGEKQVKLAEEFGMSTSQISAIKLGRYWGWIQ